MPGIEFGQSSHKNTAPPEARIQVRSLPQKRSTRRPKRLEVEKKVEVEVEEERKRKDSVGTN